MFRTDKTTGLSHLIKPSSASSAQTLSAQSLKKDKEKTDLQLTGSQIHLTYRPRLGSGRASSRSTSRSGIYSKRPVSAMPAFCHQGVHGVGMTGIGGYKRPQSADNSYFPGGDHPLSSSATSECDEKSARIAHKQYDGPRRRNKLAAKFPLLHENDHKYVTEATPPDKQTVDNNLTGLDHGFGSTYILPSSHLLGCLTSNPLGCAWTESEFEDLAIKNSYCNKYVQDSLSSDGSNGQCHSDTSLGEQIIAMAQDPKPAEQLPCKHRLEPGLASKPPLPQYNRQVNSCFNNNDSYLDDSIDDDIFFGKFNHVCGVTDKPQYLSSSSISLDQHVQVSGEPDRNNSFTCNRKSSVHSGLQNENGMLQRNLVNNVPQGMITIHLRDEIHPSTEYSSHHNSQSQLMEEREHFSEPCQNSELKHYHCTQNPSILSRIHNVSSDLEDIKVHHWFLDSVHKDTKVPDSYLRGAERQTDLDLARRRRNLESSDSCENFSIRAIHEDDVSAVYSSKPRRKELYLECLVEEYIDEHDDPASSRSDKKCCVSNHGTHNVNLEKEGDVSPPEMENTNNSLLPNQRAGNETEPELLEMSSSREKFKGNSNVPHNNVSISKEGDNLEHLDTLNYFSSADKETVTSWLNTQLESSEQEGPISTESAQLCTVDSAFQPKVTHGNLKADALQKNNITFPLDQRNMLPPPTLMPPQTHDLNVSTVGTSGSSTYDDIVTILKVLEKEETCSPLRLDGLKLTPNVDISCSETFLNGDLLDNTQNVSVPSGKLCDILKYLDEVEHCCDATLESAKSQLQAVKDRTRNSELKLTTVPRLEELLNLSTVDLAHEVLTLRLQIEEKTNSISLLQETLNEQRELAVRNTRNAYCDMKAKLREQKEEYEAAVARHQKFIDQLIADKKSLNEKCETLVLELKKSEAHQENTLKAVEERHYIELQKARDMHAAAEKLRKERWIDNKTQKIKEMTVKGLEPELQRMNTRHQQELADLRLFHKQELDELESRAARKTAQQMEQLRDQLTAEKEEALVKEKELLRQRLEKHEEQEEMNHQTQQRRLLAEIRREKERLEEEETRMREELEQTKQNMSRENAKVVERLKQDHVEAMDACTRRHKNEVKSLKEVLEIEKESWMNSYKKDQAVHASERESEMRDQYKRERDKEIELVIERLESEATQIRAELEQAMENRLRRLKEKFEAEIKELEVSEKAIKNKYNETKGKLVEKEDEVINLKANARQLEKELEEAKKIVDRLSGERAEIKEIIRKEFLSQVSSAEQENIKLREEMTELRTRHKLEISGKADEVATIMADKERQLQQVYSRVKLAVAKKDETIQKLKLQHESALERCCHLEELLEQQRRDFLLKNGKDLLCQHRWPRDLQIMGPIPAEVVGIFRVRKIQEPGFLQRAR